MWSLHSGDIGMCFRGKYRRNDPRDMDFKGGKRLEANAEWMIQRIGIAVEFTTSGSASGSGQ